MKYSIAIIVVLAGVVFNGCLSDNVDLPEVKARPTYPPGYIFYGSFENKDLQIRWTRSPSDTQLNFRGYFVQLFTSAKSSKWTPANPIDDTIKFVVDDSVFRQPTTGYLDTSTILKNIDTGRYTVYVWGVRYAPQASPDSLILSETPAIFSFDNDPRPVLVPAGLFASSGAGPTSINLSWPRSASEKNVGFSGYVIRYLDTIKTSGAVLTELLRFEVIQSDTIAALPAFENRSVVVPVNPQTLTFREYPYKFWIKAIRKDSVESADSVGIVWSGAERTAQFAVKLDTGMFVGQVNTTFAIAQTTIDNPSAEFTMHFDGSKLTVEAIGSGTSFATRVDSSSLDQTYYAAPFADNEFTESSLTLPAPGVGGSVIYALLPGGNRARIFIGRDATSGGYVNPTTNSVTLTASFQPAFTKVPFF